MTTPPMTGNREFRNEIVRIAELTVTDERIDGYTFINCQILGPAVFVFLDEVTMNFCSWEGDLNAIFWEVDPETRPLIIGAVAVSNSTFSRCRFRSVGIAGPHFVRDQLATGLETG